MKIEVSAVEHVAALARLALTSAEKEKYASQLSAILTHMEKLEALDTSGVEPATHYFDLINAFRADEPRPSLDIEDALMNAPEHDNRCFVVPRVVGGEE